MKTWKFVAICIFFLTIVGALLSLVPQVNTLYKMIGKFIFNLILAAWMTCGAFFLGWFFKRWIFYWIDNAIEPHSNMANWMRHVMGGIFIVCCGVFWIWMIPHLFIPGTWLYQLTDFMDTPPTFEMPPVWWGVVASAEFWLVWGVTDHEH